MMYFFKELFEYNHHANRALGDVYNNPGKTSEKAVQLYNHILNAHHIGNNRIKPKETPFGIWEVHPVEDLKQIETTNYTPSLMTLSITPLTTGHK